MQSVTLEVLSDLAKKEFDIELPIEFENFKSLYRTKAKELHPDLGNGDEKRFKDMQAVYDLLMSFSDNSRVFICENINKEDLCTVEGIPLSELGKGITDSLVNGADCHYCGGRGYQSRISRQSIRVVCSRCTGDGEEIARKIICRCCDNGFFTTKSGKKVSCRVCNGTGIYLVIKKRCSVCGGSGFSYKEKGIGTVYNVCFHCDGKGQIPIWNPVLPKNRVHIRREKNK